MLGGDGWLLLKLYEIVKNVFDGSYFSNYYIIELCDLKIIVFVKFYKEKYNEEVDVMVVLVYDVVYFLVEVIKNVKEVILDNICEEMIKIKDFYGVIGKMLMNENCDVVKSVVIV